MKKGILLLLVATICSLGSCKKDDDKPSYPKDITMEYIVTSTISGATADISFTNDTGGNTDQTNVSLPFTRTINKNVEFAEIFTITAASSSASSLTLEILVDDSSVKKQTFESDSYNVGVLIYQFD